MALSRFSTSFIPLAIVLSLFHPHSMVAVSSGDDNPTAYDVLAGFDFPIGILPKGVFGYDLDPDSGKFAAYMNGTCAFSLRGSYQLKYKSVIRGFISKGRLTRLEGVSVKLLWVWVDIVEVSRSANDLEFSVGIASAGFPIDNFEESPLCGCGLDCDKGQVRKLKTDPTYVYSS